MDLLFLYFLEIPIRSFSNFKILTITNDEKCERASEEIGKMIKKLVEFILTAVVLLI
jgi:hypothetical protein